MPKEISYRDLAELTSELSKEKAISITGGDVRKLTLMFCTQLTSGRYTSITKDVVKNVVTKYLNDLQDTNLSKTSEVPTSAVPEKIKKELNQ